MPSELGQDSRLQKNFMQNHVLVLAHSCQPTSEHKNKLAEVKHDPLDGDDDRNPDKSHKLQPLMWFPCHLQLEKGRFGLTPLGFRLSSNQWTNKADCCLILLSMLVHLTPSPQFHSWWERHICALNAAPHSVHPDTASGQVIQVNFKLFLEPNDALCLKDVSARRTFKVNKNCWMHFMWMQLCSGAFLVSIVRLCLQLAGNEKINQVKCGRG